MKHSLLSYRSHTGCKFWVLSYITAVIYRLKKGIWLRKQVLFIFIEFGALRKESPRPGDIGSKNSTLLIPVASIEHDSRFIPSASHTHIFL
jgi:hypothetical protein